MYAAHARGDKPWLSPRDVKQNVPSRVEQNGIRFRWAQVPKMSPAAVPVPAPSLGIDIQGQAQHLQVLTLRELCTLDITTPVLQRPLDIGRVNDIIAWQRARLAAHGSLLFVGGLTCAQIAPSVSHLLMDGQHRYHSMRALAPLQPDYRITMNVVRCPDAGISLDELFEVINRSEPVPDYVIRTTLQAHRRVLLDGVRELIVSSFTAFVSPSRNPRRPNVNVDLLVDHIHDSDLLARHPVTSCDSAQLFRFLMYANACAGYAHPIRALHADEKAAKAGCSPLYLGNDSDGAWTRDAALLGAFVSSPELMGAPLPLKALMAKAPLRSSVRVSIPRAVRNSVWNVAFGREAGIGACYCCCGLVSQQDFECGHVLAVAMGGLNVLENLKPVCGACNKSIGSRDMDAFKLEFGFPKLPSTHSGCAP